MSNLSHRGIPLLCIMLFSITAPASGSITRALPSGDQVWFATRHGLYRYNKTQDEWSVFSTGNGLAGNDVRHIGINEGIIWVATDGGVSNSDVRFSDWRSYTTEDGLPSNDIKCIAFSEDYVWIGTDNGAARFDKLLEEWESYTEADGLAGHQVSDIAVDGETVWFATSNGVSKFEIEFSKWTIYRNELPSLNVTWAMVMGEYLWLVTDDGLARYDKQLRSWKLYTIADGIVSYLINDVVVDGNNIWLATRDGVSSFDLVSDSWSVGTVYHTMLPSRNVADLAIDGNVIWFCTDAGVSSYDRESGVWRHYTTGDGLLDNVGQEIVVSGQVFVVTEKGINIYDKKTQEWETYEFSENVAGAIGEGRGERGIRLDEQGIGYDLSSEARLRLSGFSSLEYAGVSTLRPERSDEYERDVKNDLSLRGTIPGRRSIVGFYDDTDEEDVEYGITYRGNDADLLQEVTGGEFEARMRNADLIEDINLVGAGARLRKRFDGTRLNVESRYGQQRGYFETDFFTYKTGTTIYQLSHENVIPGTEELRINKQVLPSGDYLIVYPSGWLVFHREELVEEGEQIEIRYQYEAEDEEAEKPRLGILTTGLDLGNNYYAGFDVLHGDDLDVISLNAEGKDMAIGPVSLRLRPEVAYSRRQTGDNAEDGVASRGEFVANAPRTQFKADYEVYGEDFWTIGKRETRFGDLERYYGAYSQVDIAQWMPLTLQWQRERSGGDNMVTTSEDDARANIVFSKKPYPTFALTGERNEAKSPELEETENSARADLQYDLPESLLSYIRFRRAEVNGYYKQSHRDSIDAKDRTQTGYAKLLLYPMEQFVLSTSYRLNRAKEKESGFGDYRLREELERLLIRSSFASIDGLISAFSMDDLRSQSRTPEGHLVEDKDRFLATSLNLLPGAWVKRLEMLTLAGTYSFIQQTVPTAENKRADSNARSTRLQANLRPHNMILWTGTYHRVKNWVENIPPVTKTLKYRSEAELRPSSRTRVVLDYYQEHEDKDNIHQENLYSPSLWWETNWSRSWTTRLRSVYDRSNIRENGKTLETGSTLTPSLSFRYTARELPHDGKLYLTQAFSVSVYRGERGEQDLSSETYLTSFVAEWRITRNLSFRARAGLSYEDDHTQGKSDEGSANVYVRALARF
jgi:frataxin-like iron-binding protein CyaY